MTNTQLTPYSVGETKNNSLKTKDVQFHHFYSTYYWKSLSQERRKRNKRYLSWKERNKIKLSLFADGILPFIEDHKDPTQKLLELINEFSKVVN